MAIDFIDRPTLERIIEHRDDVCMSIYLPMARKGPDVRGNVVQLKNTLNEVGATLEARGWGRSKIEDLLAQPRLLLDDSPYWQHQQDGLVLFIAPEFYEAFRLPIAFEPLTVVGERFHIKPILPLFSENGQFYVLALSQNSVRLFRGSRHSIEEVDTEEMDAAQIPHDMAEALAFDDPEEQLQHHTTTSGAEGAGGPAVVHHGHTVEDEENLRLRRFLQQVNRGIANLLKEDERPLVLAAVAYLHPLFKNMSRVPTLLDEGIEGNPEHIDAEQLRDKAWEIAAPHFTEARERARTRFNELAHSEQATDDLHNIIPAAFQGRVDSLFVAVNEHAWGQYDPETNDIALHESDQREGEDLLDFAVVQTLANGGAVYALDAAEVPGKKPIAAVLRF